VSSLKSVRLTGTWIDRLLLKLQVATVAPAGQAFLDAAGQGQQAPAVFHRHVVGQAGLGLQPVGQH
jgi:hypothetical protein